MGNFTGKVAVVLGASAPRGTGWAVAEALAAEGASVVVAARTLPNLHALAGKIGGTAIQCDAGDARQIAALASATIATYGRLDIAVNAAGLPIQGPIASTTEADLLAGVRVNYFGVVFFIKYMAAIMQAGGCIINLSSISSTHPNGDFFAYSCAKAAADCLVRSAAIEYAPRQIRINSILPGPIDSDLAAGVFDKPGIREVFLRETPLSRIGQPADFANAVLWLAGPAFVTGLNLQVNGGMHLMRQPQTRELAGGADAYAGSAVPLADQKM